MIRNQDFSNAAGLTKETQERAYNEFVELLSSTRRKGVEAVIEWIGTSRFCTTSGSTHNHSSFRGGLLCHSLNVGIAALRLRQEKLDCARTQAQRNNLEAELPRSSVVLAALLHDVSKEPLYLYDNGSWVQDEEVARRGHGQLSLDILDSLGLQLTTKERIAIRWHDYDLKKEKVEWAAWKPTHSRESKTPLLDIVHKADRLVRPLEDGTQAQGIFLPLHYIDFQPLKDTELRVRHNLEGYPSELVETYPINDSFAYNAHKEVDCGEAVSLPKDTVSVLSMRYPCSLPFEGKTFASAEVLVLYQLYSQSPDMQARIASCTTSEEAKDLCSDTKKRDSDWKSKLHEARVKALKVKAQHCQEYKSKLKESGSKPIVQLSNYPRFLTLGEGAVPGKALGGDSWQEVAGIQDLYLGCNSVGKAHMAVRESIV